MLFNKSKSTEVHFNQNNDIKKSGPQSNIETKKGVSPFKIFSLLKQQKMKEKENLEEVNHMDELIEKLTVDLKKPKTIDYTDEKAMEKLYSEKQKQCIFVFFMHLPAAYFCIFIICPNNVLIAHSAYCALFCVQFNE